MPSSLLSCINPDLNSAGRVPKQGVLGIGLVLRDPGRGVDLDWTCCGWISGTSLYGEVDIDSPCVEATQVRNTQIDTYWF